MRSLPVWLAATVAVLGAVATNGAEQQPTPTTREIYVPLDQLDVLLEGPTRRVLMSRTEYDELMRKARRRPTDRVPQEALLSAADYELTIDDLRASIRARLTCEVLADGLHALPLDLHDVGIRTALLDGRPASLGRGDDGRPTLFVAGRGRHEAVLTLVTPLETDAAQQRLNLRLPRPPAARLGVVVPGNVEVRSGADVIRREVDEAAGVTRLELVPVDGPLSLALSLNNRQRALRRVVTARSVLVGEVTTAYERLHATVSLGILHQAVDHFRFALPEGFEVADVQSPALARWSTTIEGDRRVLEVRLRQETTDTVVLNIAALRTPARLDDWTFPDLEPLDVVGRAAVVGLLLEDRLQAENVAAAALLPIDAAVLAQALPASVFQAEPGAPQIRPVAAYYSADGRVDLAARFVRPPSRLRVTSNLLLTAKESGLEVRGGFALSPEAEALHQFRFSVPTGWHVVGITAADGAALPFERYAGTDAGAERIDVRLPKKIDVGNPQSVFFHAEQTPDGWLDEWTTKRVEFPKFAVVHADGDVGTAAVAVADDLVVRPDVMTNLTPLGDAEKANFGTTGDVTPSAYRYDTADWSATLIVERTLPRLTARTFSFFRIEPDVLTAHYELIFDVTRARARRLSFILPATTPTTIAIRALDGRALKEYASEDVEGGRRWTALLVEGAQGRLRLAIDFPQPLPAEEVENYALPIVRADGVSYQSGIVAVEGSAEIDVAVVKHPRKADVGELVEADYQTGRRLLGAFGFVDDEPIVAIDVVRRPQYALQPALVQQARYVTQLGVGGRAQTSAELQLRTKAGFLEVKLPTGSTLWSAVLDGLPAQPQREGDRLLLGFPSTTGDALRTLTIVYETPVAQLASLGRIVVPALSLFLRSSAGAAATEVPVADVRWTLHLPPGYDLLHSGGSVAVADGARTPQLAAVRVGEFLVAVGGGFGPQIKSARESARSKSGKGAAALSPYEEDVGYLLGAPGREDASKDKAVSDGTTPLTRDRQRLLGGRGEQELKQQLERLELEPRSPATTSPMNAPADLAAAAPKGTLGDALAPIEAEGLGKVAPAAPSKYAKFDLAGVRSLKIALQSTDDVVVFQSLGVAPRLDVTLVDRRQSQALAGALALAAVLYGVRLTKQPASRKLRFVFVVALAATLLPPISGFFVPVDLVNPTFYAVCCLLPFYFVAWCVGGLYRVSRQTFGKVPAAALTVVTCLATAVASAAEPAVGERPIVVQVNPPTPPVKVPDDALILLYPPTDKPGVPQAEQLLVPYERYQELWNRANPDEASDRRPPPASYAPAGATFTATLAGDDYLLVEGRLTFDLFVDDFVQVPLPLTGGVLASAQLDGRPARLNVVRPEPQQPLMKSQTEAPLPSALPVLIASGKGRHQLDLSIRLSLSKVGGWRIAEGLLPAGGAASLTLTVPDAATDVRLAGVHDRRTYATTRPRETIVTAATADRPVRIEWRPKIDQGRVDLTLKARSEAVLAVQEDGLRLAWRTTLEFGGTQRESFTLDVPADYLLERVAGENVRSWEARDDGGARKLDVTLLQPAADGERFTVYLSRRTKLGDAATEFTAPIVGVEGAAVHGGQIALHRSRLLELRTVEAAGLTRVDADAAADAVSASAEPADVSPLGMQPYQTYRFAAPSFTLKLAIDPATTKTTADLQTIVRIAERERRLETQIRLGVQGPPLYRLQVYLPDELELDRVSAPGAFERAVTTDGGRRMLSVYFAAGQTGAVNVVLAGVLGRPGPLDVVPLPRLEVREARRQQGDVVVQVDPAFNVEATDLRGCERVLLDRTFGWLAEAQRASARLALQHATGDYGGNLRLTLRKPTVRCRTVTNVRVTDRTIEETILLDFTIREAGVRETTFLLPATLRNARISVPGLRQQTIEPVGDDGRRIRVRLQLQDDVMNQLRVLVENDRARSADVQTAPLPTIETGETDGRFIALESSGRDEVVVEQAVGLEPLHRRQQQWQVIAGLLGGGSTQAFRVAGGDVEPQLTYRTRTRAAVETVGARIGLAEATLVVDASGAYRAVQTYRLDNKSEPYLTVELPEGATLWTVWAAGEPVKPTAAPPPASPREVRVPLVKTAEGDLDYEVRLVYGGKPADLDSFRRTSFPLMKTVNVKVELSQVRLYLPEAYRWINFGGTMRRVHDEAELQAGSLSYYNKSTEKLAQTLERGDDFAKVRASNSLRRLQSDVHSLLDAIGGDYRSNDNAALQQELRHNDFVMQQAAEQQRQVRAAQQQPQSGTAGALTVNNSVQLNAAFEGQGNARARNVVSGLTSNFSASTFTGETTISGGTVIDSRWFAGNRLNDESDRRGTDLERKRQPERPVVGAFAAAAPSPTKPTAEANESRVQFGAVSQPAAAPRLTTQPQSKTSATLGAAPDGENAPAGDRGGKGEGRGQADVVQRYQRRLEEQTKQMEVTDRPTALRVEVGAVNVFTSSGGAMAGEVPPPADAAGLVGLDVEIPLRGTLYRFTTPLGEADVSAMPIATPFVESLRRLSAVLVATIVIWTLWRSAGGRIAAAAGSRTAAALLAVFGLLSIVTGVLPVLGLLLIGTGVVLFIRRRFATQ